jgi:Na+/H+ antiporter NhaC
LWDWLQLLVLPLVVILMPLWMRAGARVSAPVAWILVAILASLVVCFAGGYVFRWDWTGCVGKTFRDWLNLLITPFAIPLVCAWFLAAREIADSAPTSPPPDRPTATEEKGTSLAATARD